MQYKQCPLNPDYKFCTKCAVKSCINFTPRTKNRCLSLDVRPTTGEDPVTDSELLHYKFPDKELTLKDVTRIRKRSVDRIHQWIGLHKILHHIREKCAKKQILVSDNVAALKDMKPFNIQDFNFEVWMLVYLIDDKFCKSVVPLFSLKDILGYVQTEYDSFCAEIKSLIVEEIP